MIDSILFFFLIALMKSTSLPEAFHILGVKMQFFCAHLAPNSKHLELYNALVCGTAVHNFSVVETFRATGLIHILVVSGSHLTWVEQMLRFFPKWISAPLLTAYAFSTGFAPPVARSFWQRLLVWKSKRRLTLPLQVAISGAWTWALIPLEANNLSLQLSWACAILLGVCHIAHWKRPWIPCCILFLGLYPLLSGFQPLHPGTILLNLSVAGIFGAVLFPLSLLCFALPALTVFVDPLWTALIYGLSSAAEMLSTTWQPRNFNEAAAWIYVVSLQILFYLLDLRLRRATS